MSFARFEWKRVEPRLVPVRRRSVFSTVSMALLGVMQLASHASEAGASPDAGAFANAGDAGARTPFLLWRFEPAGRDPGNVFDMCKATSVAWMNEKDQVVWTRPVPAWLREVNICNADYPRHPRDWRGRSPITTMIAEPIATRDALAFAEWGGVWVLRVRDGATLLDHAMDWRLPDRDPPRARFYFDSGAFEWSGGAAAERCTGPAPEARVFARSGSQLVYFNGTRAAAIDMATWKVVDEVAMPASAVKRGKMWNSTASVSVGGRTLTLRGRTYE